LAKHYAPLLLLPSSPGILLGAIHGGLRNEFLFAFILIEIGGSPVVRRAILKNCPTKSPSNEELFVRTLLL
jgi:hypothetical protein